MIEALKYIQDNGLLIQFVILVACFALYHVKVAATFLKSGDGDMYQKQIDDLNKRLENNYYRISETYAKSEINDMMENHATDKDIIHIQEIMETRFSGIESHISGINQRIDELKQEFNNFNFKLDKLILDRKSKDS